MALTDLIFSLAPATGQPVNLVFGGDTTAAPATVNLTLDGVLPPPVLAGTVVIVPITPATLAGVLAQPALSGLLDVRQTYIAALVGVLPTVQLVATLPMEYISNTARPTVGQSQTPWQVADLLSTGAEDNTQDNLPTHVGAAPHWQVGSKTPLATGVLFGESDRTPVATAARSQTAQRSNTDAMSVYSNAQRSMRRMLANAFQSAERAQTPMLRSKHQDGIRDKTSAINGTWQVAARNRVIGTTGTSSPALWLNKGWNQDHENAMRPPAGIYARPPVSVGEPCYLPHANLLFAMPWSADTNLVFICERHVTPPPGAAVVVPLRRTYVTINSITLRRVDGDVAIPTYAFQMSLDVDSWTWSWSASVPVDALALVQPGSNGELVEVEALVNGVPYRLYAEGIASQRQFGQARIAVKGRGKAAMLDAPYAPVLNHGNTAPRTAQQLMTDVLTVNGVGIGWSVDWSLTDWLVPGNTWATQGAYIGAVLNIAQAAGGYVQPHDTAQTLRILPRYPAAPWNWGSTVTPDFELPAAVVAVEGIDWTRKADYNRVFVSGTSNGVLGQVTRAGTAGASVAPMVTDALITHADAARQRGLAILSDTGHQARVTLTLPVLAETGLIKPGQFVRYLAGGESRLGLVRSTSLAWSRPKLRQTIAVETHVL